jgi:ketosteroid isomerase-like protein
MAKGEIESPELEEYLRIARAVLEAYGQAATDGEIDAFLELLDPDVDLELPSAIRRGVVSVRGRDEARQYLEEITDEYLELQLEPREFRSLSNGRLLVVGRWRGQLRGGTTPFGTPLAVIIELRDGKVARLRGFMDIQQALEAAGDG